MNFNKSLLNYIFKEGLENDQASERISSILQNIDIKLKDEDLVYTSKSKESISLQEYLIETKLERIEYLLSLVEVDITKLDDKVRERLVSLKLKLLESKDLVRQALLGERSLIGESYTLQIPLKKEYSTKLTTATLENEVIFGVGFNENSVQNKVDLSSLQLRSEEETYFKISSDTNSFPFNIEFDENYHKPYNQVKVAITNLTQTGILFIKFKNAEVISVLDKNGYEIIEPFITNTLTINIEHNTQYFSLRFANNKSRVVSILEMYFTEAIYNTTTVFETVPYIINKDLSFLTVETCDNYSTKDININYEISINNSSYRAFRPNGKLNANKIQSIIRTREVNPTEVKISYTDNEKGYYRYYNENLVSMSSKLRVFNGKMGEDFYSLENYVPKTTFKVYLYTPKDFIINLSPSMFVYVNDLYYVYNSTNKGKIEIKKGINSLTINKNFWKEIVDLDEYEIISVDRDKIVVVKRNDKSRTKIEVINYFDTGSLASNSVYLQIFKENCIVYLEEENIRRKYNKDYIEYLYKETPSPIYVYSEAYQTTVETIQIKATMKTADYKICPYISKMVVRGV